MGRLIALICALAAGLLLAWAQSTPRPARPADAPIDQFSAARAMADVRAIAARPHPQGSPENALVRDHLVRRLTSLGLETQVRGGGNIVAVLPGRDRALPALALMAHYDSVSGSPGAGDDAAGVAAILETLGALRADGTPAHDVMALLTDGEENGLLGAKAFFGADPLAARVGYVLNIETRGNGGRPLMFQTGRPGGGDVRLFQSAAPRPQANSLLALVYERMPNDTDFTEALRAGKPGLNFAFIGRQFDYHSATSTPENLSQGALQEVGDQVLASSRAFLADPPQRQADLVYSQAGPLLIAYPPVSGWLLWGLAVVALVLRVARLGPPRAWLGMARGGGGFLYLMFGAVAVLHLARLIAGRFVDARALTAQPLRWEMTLLLLGGGVTLAAIAGLARGRRWTAVAPMLAIAVACCALAGGPDAIGLVAGLAAAGLGLVALSRPTDRRDAWTGALAVGLALGGAAQALAPQAAFLIVWPLLAATGLALALSFAAPRSRLGLVAAGLVAAPVCGWLGVYGHLFYMALDLPLLLAIPLSLAALVVWPLAQPEEGAPPARLVGAACIVAGTTLLAFVCLDPPWSARHPKEAAHVVHSAPPSAATLGPSAGPSI